MRYLAPLLLLAAPLEGCAALAALPTSPSEAPQSGIDETALRVGTAATNGYTAASKAGVILVRLGALDKAKFKALDNKGFALVEAMHDAYLARNAGSYAAAANKLNEVVADFANLFSGGQ